jgi:hypothetical protein
MTANRRGRPPGSKSEAVEADPRDGQAEPKAELNSVALSVVKNGDMWQLVKISFDPELLIAGKPEVVMEDTDRWEVQAQFDFECEETFLFSDDV